jgi:hypothetical protein
MAKPTLISSKLKPRIPQRSKYQCGCAEKSEELNAGMLYRITECEGVIEAECADCWQSTFYFYSETMVKQMIDAAIEQANSATPNQ